MPTSGLPNGALLRAPYLSFIVPGKSMFVIESFLVSLPSFLLLGSNGCGGLTMAGGIASGLIFANDGGPPCVMCLGEELFVYVPGCDRLVIIC